MVTALLLVDPQNDFCSPNGSLFVPGASEDCQRIAAFIRKHKDSIDHLYVTLDSHPSYHIAHPLFWRDSQGNPPAPFTEITYADYQEGKFLPVDANIIKKVGQYIQELEKRGRYNLIVWPFHCLKGSTGMAVEQKVWQASHEWECSRPATRVMYITKADNPYTEHYSALQAEVPDPNDSTTAMNHKFLDELKKADRIIIAGEALSHCVANTIRDLITYIPPSAITLLSDCSSPVSGFETVSELFLDEMCSVGMQCTTSTKITL